MKISRLTTLIFVGLNLFLPWPGRAQDAWQKTLAEAKKEATVVINGPSIRDLSQGMVDAVKKTYGIDVEYLGLGVEIITRIEREAQAALCGDAPTDWRKNGDRERTGGEILKRQRSETSLSRVR